MKLEASGAQSSGLIRHWRIDLLIVIPQMGMALRKAGFLMTLLESPKKCKLLINSNLCQQTSRLAFDLLYQGTRLPMNELRAGVLMLLVCVVVYIQADPRFWSIVYQLVSRFMGVSN
jgi:hypothetical protein